MTEIIIVLISIVIAYLIGLLTQCISNIVDKTDRDITYDFLHNFVIGAFYIIVLTILYLLYLIFFYAGYPI